MPEIKNAFIEGKMNKDLDERLVPSGQYRHAENIKVSTSDDGSVGVVQNILGNKRVEDYVPAGYVCIATIADEKNNNVYWFVTNESTHFILQYNLEEDLTKFVLVDTKNDTLKFTQNIITGINIIDDLLFWTDNYSEPKKINIKDCILGTEQDSLTHTKLFVDGIEKGDISEKHITVIKQSPKHFPSTSINEPTDQNASKLFEQVFPRFSLRYKYKDGEYSSFGPFTQVVFNPKYVGDDVTQDNAYSLDESYNLAMINNVESIEISNFVSTSTPSDVVQVEILYKEDSSSTVFSIKKINYNDDEWNNNTFTLKSESIFAAIPENQSIRVWDNVPKKALAQEITGNRLVYGNYTQGYDLLAFGNNPQVSNKLESSFELRDNNQDFSSGGKPSLKTQRNYQVGFVWGDKYGRETPVFTSDDGGVSIPWYNNDLGHLASKSLILKTNLNTNIPLWADYYKIYVKETSGDYYNLIMDKAYVQTGFSAFDDQEDRVWLSFPSADRNKVTIDDYLILKREVGISQEQVKLENKFKILDIQNEAPDAIKFEYKVLGKATQTDDAGTGDYLTNNIFPSAGTNRIDHTTDMIHVKKSDWLDVTGGGSLTPDNDNDNLWDDSIYISWRSGNDRSSKYRVISANVLGNPAYYRLKLDRLIEEKDAGLASIDGVINDNTKLFKTDLQFFAEVKTEKDLDEYSGRFFVQIVYKPEAVSSTENILDNPFTITSLQNIHWFYDPTTANSIELDGIVNVTVDLGFLGGPPTDTSKAVTTSTSGSTYEASEWGELSTQLENSDNQLKPRGFFIDNMYMVAGQPFTDNTRSTSVKLSGKTWVGWGEIGGPMVRWAKVGDDGSGNWSGNYGWTTEGDDGGDFFTEITSSYTPRPLNGFYTSYPKNVLKSMNGLEGFLTTKTEHVGNTVDGYGGVDFDAAGYRRWKKFSPILSDSNPLWGKGDDTYNTKEYGEIPPEGDLNSEGKFFVHLSFLGPGKDLHDGIWPTDFHNFAELKGANSPGAHMQGIWGGGVFTGGGKVLEMEGNYQPDLTPNPDAPGPSAGYGYDTSSSYGTDNDRQWDPSYPAEDDEGNKIKKFLENLHVPNARFRFSSSSTKEFKIIGPVKEKRIYNHTSWIAQYKWDGVTQNPTVGNGLVLCQNSVDEKAETFLNETTSLGKFNDLLTTITKFGKRDNRRVVYIFEVDKNPLNEDVFTSGSPELDSNTALGMEFISSDPGVLLEDILDNPAIWETEAKAGEDLDIYYEASQAIPLSLNNQTNELFAPIGSRVEILNLPEARNGESFITKDIFVESWSGANGNEVNLDGDGFNRRDANGGNIDYSNAQIRFFRPDGSYTTTRIIQEADGPPDQVVNLILDTTLDAAMEQGAAYYNCFSFGNGIESNRVRDDFNAPAISKGVKASLVLETDYKEENRKNGLIYSGIYNSNSGVNNLNQFIIGENITKDLNPTYGSIQKLFQRRISLVAFCEDKVVSIVSNKDALFNADGNVQLVSTNNVLGDATPFVGDYGISQNPESFAKESYRAYFTDKQRGAVLRLSMDGITPISEAGMDDYFRDNLVLAGEAVGTYDAHSKNYNLTLKYPKPGDNLITNNSFSFGVGSTSSSFSNTIANPNINSFTPVSLPTIDTTLNWFANPDINVETTITNYDEIGVGELIAETSTTTTTVNANTAFTADDSNASFYSGSYTDDTKDNPFHTGQFNFKLDVTSIYGGFQGQSAQQYPTVFLPYPLTPPHSSSSNNFWNASVSSGFFGPSGDLFWNPEIDSYTTSNNNSIAANPGGYDNGAASVDEPWFFNANANSTTGQNTNVGTGIVFDGSSGTSNIGNSLIVPGIPTYVSPQSLPAQVQTQYSGAEDNTIFNGEEVKLRFFFRNAVDSNFLGGSGPHNRKIQIQLYDGATALSDSILLDPSTTALTDTNYSTYQIASPNSGTYEVGYATTASYTFAEMIDDANHLHEIYFKFTDGTENEGIVVQDLQIHISMLGGSGHTGVCLGSMSSLNIRKVFELTSAEDITITTTPDNNPVPDAPIPAFATVQHLVQNHDLVEGGGASLVEHTFVTRAKNAYGFNFQALDTITLTQTGSGATATYQFPSSGNVSNGTVFYDDGTSGTGMFADGTYNTDDIFTFDSARTEDTIVKQTGSVSLNVGNWYFVDIRYNGTPSIPTTPITIQSVAANGTLGAAHDTEFVTTTTDIYGTSEDVLRAIFQIDIPQANDDKIKIRIPQDVDIEVESFHTQAINATYTGGSITNWPFNNDQNPPQHSFDVPTIYGSSNGIEFDVAHSNSGGLQRYSFQQLNPIPVESNGGYTFSFTLSNYGSGYLHFYVIGKNAAGADEGIVFKKSQADIYQDGDYYVDFNFDGGAYDLFFDDGTGPVSLGTSDSPSSGSTSVIEKAIFLSNGQHGFVGCVTNISLVDKTIVFSGGSVDSFTIEGFDTTLDNFITFEDLGSGEGQVLFNNAPITALSDVRIQQGINANINEDDTYKLKFEHAITSGSIGAYYYSSKDNKGFKVENISGSGTYDVVHTMNEDWTAGHEIDNLVFFVDTDGTTGAIDNIVFRREYLAQDNFPATLSYSEKVRGWVSFKSFIPEQGVSLAGEYFTAKDGGLYLHNVDGEPRNTFYGEHADSSVTTLLNSSPSSVKIFNTLNYEGTQSKVKQYVVENHDGNDYSTLSTYNLKEEKGWSVEHIKTDKQEGTLDEFIEKEGKWFNYIKGLNSDSNQKTSDLSFQGLGIIKKIDTII